MVGCRRRRGGARWLNTCRYQESLAERGQALQARRVQHNGSWFLAPPLFASRLSGGIPRPRNNRVAQAPCGPAGLRDRARGWRSMGKGKGPRGRSRRFKEECTKILQVKEKSFTHLQACRWWRLSRRRSTWVTHEYFPLVSTRGFPGRLAFTSCTEVRRGRKETMPGRRAQRAWQGFRSPRAGNSSLGEGQGPSAIEERLRALKRPSALKRVSFAPGTALPSSDGAREHRRDSPRGGPGDRADVSTSLVPVIPRAKKMKDEVIDVDEESTRRAKKDKTVGESLAEAARKQTLVDKKPKKKRRRSSSHSRGRRSHRKRRRSSSRDSRSDSSGKSSSSSASLMPPLKRKSLKSPGTVFRMLEDHVAERLAQDTTLGDGQTDSLNSLGQGKFHAFFQLCLKPQLDPKSRDSKELFLLSRSLDLLKQGNLDQQMYYQPGLWP